MASDIRWTRGLVLALALVLPEGSIAAQTTSFYGGVSSSYEKATDELGTARSQDLWAPVIGVSRTFELATRVRFETGVAYARKRETRPAMYIEVPAVVHVGLWPRARGLGVSLGGGALLDLGIPMLERSQVAGTVGAQVHAGFAPGTVWSVGLWYSQGIDKANWGHLHTWAFTMTVPARTIWK